MTVRTVALTGASRRHARSTAAALRLLAGLIADPGSAPERLVRLPGPDLAQLTALARAHGVEAWLAGHAPLRGGVWQPLADQRMRFIAAQARTRAEIGRIGAAADELGCNWVVVKGLALADGVYPRPHLRHAVDIDVLVDPRHFADLLSLLQSRGWRPLDVNARLLRRTQPGQLRLCSPRGSLLDLHWHVLDSPRLRREFALPTTELLDRRRVLPSGVPVLDPVDQLLHVAVHAALSGANRLLWLADAGLAARQISSWRLAGRTAEAAGASAALVLVLDRARRWLGTPSVPPASGALPTGSGAWRTMCVAVDRLSPLGARPDAPAIGRSFARSTRSTPIRSLIEFVRHGMAYARSGLGRAPMPSPLLDPASPESLLHPVDDADARRQYLAAVTSAESDGRSTRVRRGAARGGTAR